MDPFLHFGRRRPRCRHPEPQLARQGYQVIVFCFDCGADALPAHSFSLADAKAAGIDVETLPNSAMHPRPLRPEKP
jgi:hypothetical protein